MMEKDNTSLLVDVKHGEFASDGSRLDRVYTGYEVTLGSARTTRIVGSGNGSKYGLQCIYAKP